MKICSACLLELPQDSYSKTQWKLKCHQRRCKTCIDENRPTQQKPPPKFASTDSKYKETTHAYSSGASCWICLEEGPNELGEPLRRDCSCRGEAAGFAHLTCVVDYAKTVSKATTEAKAFTRPWTNCNNCKQAFNEELAADLANEFVAFVQRAYRGDKQRLFEALFAKLDSIRRLDENIHPNKLDVAKRLACQILAMIRQEKDEHVFMPFRTFVEEKTYYARGLIILGEKKIDSPIRALSCFKKCREISQLMGDVEGIDNAELGIALAYTAYTERGGYNEEDIRRLQDTYERHVRIYGASDNATINLGISIAECLRKTQRSIEAERLVMSIAATSKRVHGPHHKYTEIVESVLEYHRARFVLMYYGGSRQIFQALRYDKNRCVVQGPMLDLTFREWRISTVCMPFIVPTGKIVIMKGTPVVCHMMDKKHEDKVGVLQSWDKERDSYEVHFDDESMTCLVEAENVSILFHLPNE